MRAERLGESCSIVERTLLLAAEVNLGGNALVGTH